MIEAHAYARGGTMVIALTLLRTRSAVIEPEALVMRIPARIQRIET